MLSPQPIFTIHAELDVIRSLGHTPYGERRVINILGGRVDGAKLKGRILPGGADWQIVRADGVAEIEARYAIEADDGALVMVESRGLRHGPTDVMARLMQGDRVDPALYYFRSALRFETAAPSLAWLNRVLTIARGIREPRAVRLDVFEVQ